MGMPPTAFTNDRKASKSTCTKWLMGMPKFCWIVLMSSVGPPVASAELIFSW